MVFDIKKNSNHGRLLKLLRRIAIWMIEIDSVLSMESAKQLTTDIEQLLDSRGFKLKGWILFE